MGLLCSLTSARLGESVKDCRRGALFIIQTPLVNRSSSRLYSTTPMFTPYLPVTSLSTSLLPLIRPRQEILM